MLMNSYMIERDMVKRRERERERWALVGVFSNNKYLFKQTKGLWDKVCAKKQGFLMLPSNTYLSLSLYLLHHFSLSLSLLALAFLHFISHNLVGRMEGEVEVASCTNEKKGRFKRICVFCGSRAGHKSAFSDAALELGKELVERNIDLVYGGGSIGLMGLVSRTVFDGGCHVLGVIPIALLPHEISGETIGEVKTVADMHQRKSEMEKHADAFIALPGGYGTMEELLEMITWSQLGIHDKPVGLLNVDGYYNSLLALFDKGVDEGFIDHSARHIVVIANTAQDLINKMEDYAPIHDKVAPRQSWEVDQLLESTQSGEALTS